MRPCGEIGIFALPPAPHLTPPPPLHHCCSIGLGDWGRCGSPTNNPVTRATRCTVQRRMVPAMEQWAASLKAQYPSLFLMSVGDNCA